MYIPTAFAQTDPATLAEFIDAHGFAVLVSTDEAGVPFASHLPLILDRQSGQHGALLGHMARANPHWRYAEGKRVLVIFSGPHYYISPAWYRAEKVVPTWNYTTVHVTGTFRAMHEPAELWPLVRALVARSEAGREKPWRLAENEYEQGRLKHIVGFRIEIDRIEGKWKLNQNHPRERRLFVIEELRKAGSDDALEMAEMMERMNR